MGVDTFRFKNKSVARSINSSDEGLSQITSGILKSPSKIVFGSGAGRDRINSLV